MDNTRDASICAPQAYKVYWAIPDESVSLKDMAEVYGMELFVSIPPMSAGNASALRIRVSQDGVVPVRPWDDSIEKAIFISYRTRNRTAGQYDSGLQPAYDRTVW